VPLIVSRPCRQWAGSAALRNFDIFDLATNYIEERQGAMA